MKYHSVLVVWLAISVIEAVAPVFSHASTFCEQTQMVPSLLKYEACLETVMKMMFYNTSPKGESSITFLQQLCNSDVNIRLEKCQQQLEFALGLCMSPTQRKLLDILKSANWAGLHYICRDAAKYLSEFRELGGLKCLRKSERIQQQCVRNHPLLSMYITQYQGTFCDIEQPMGLDCLKTALSQAHCSSTAADFLNGYYQSLVDATPCCSVGLRSSTILLVSVIVITMYSNFEWK